MTEGEVEDEAAGGDMSNGEESGNETAAINSSDPQGNASDATGIIGPPAFQAFDCDFWEEDAFGEDSDMNDSPPPSGSRAAQNPVPATAAAVAASTYRTVRPPMHDSGDSTLIDATDATASSTRGSLDLLPSCIDSSSRVDRAANVLAAPLDPAPPAPIATTPPARGRKESFPAQLKRADAEHLDVQLQEAIQRRDAAVATAQHLRSTAVIAEDAAASAAAKWDAAQCVADEAVACVQALEAKLAAVAEEGGRDSDRI